MSALVQAVGRLLSELHAAFPVAVCPGDWAWTTTLAGGLVGLLPALGAGLVALARRWTGNGYGAGPLLGFALVGLTFTAALPWLAFLGASEVFRGALGGRAAAVGLRRADLATLGSDYCFAPPQVQYLGGSRTVREVLGALSQDGPGVFVGGVLLLVVLPLLALVFVYAQARIACRRGPAWPARLLWLPLLLLLLGTASLSATVVAHLWLGFLPASVLGVLAVALVGAPTRAAAGGGSDTAVPPASMAPPPGPRRGATPAGARGAATPHGGLAYPPRYASTAGPAAGGPAVGGPAVGGPAVGGPAVGGPAVGGPAVGGPAGAGTPYPRYRPAGTAPPRSPPPRSPAPLSSSPYPGSSGQPRVAGQPFAGAPPAGQPHARPPFDRPPPGGSASRPGQLGGGAPGTPSGGQAPRRPTAPLGLPDALRQREGPDGSPEEPNHALAADPGPMPATLQRALGLSDGGQREPDAPEPPTLPPSRFRRIRPLGSGGFGTVWLAMDTTLDRTVAVKAAKVPDAETERRIRREARALAAVHHPHCVRIYDIVADTDGELALIMEYVPGRSLNDVVEADGTLPDGAAARLWSTLAGALHAAHAQGVLHRDVKPSNIIIDEAGHPHLIDFGIARTTGDVTLTAAGMVLGTPDYMAPEVAAGKPASPAADAWQLAATVSFALAGRPPRGHRDGAIAAMLAAAQGEFCNQLPARTAHRGLLEAVLHPDPARRPALPVVNAELTRWLAATGQPVDAPVTRRLPRQPSRPFQPAEPQPPAQPPSRTQSLSPQSAPPGQPAEPTQSLSPARSPSASPEEPTPEPAWPTEDQH